MDTQSAADATAQWTWLSVALGLLFLAGLLAVVFVVLSGRGRPKDP